MVYLVGGRGFITPGSGGPMLTTVQLR